MMLAEQVDTFLLLIINTTSPGQIRPASGLWASTLATRDPSAVSSNARPKPAAFAGTVAFDTRAEGPGGADAGAGARRDDIRAFRCEARTEARRTRLARLCFLACSSQFLESGT